MGMEIIDWEIINWQHNTVCTIDKPEVARLHSSVLCCCKQSYKLLVTLSHSYTDTGTVTHRKKTWKQEEKFWDISLLVLE